MTDSYAIHHPSTICLPWVWAGGIGFSPSFCACFWTWKILCEKYDVARNYLFCNVHSSFSMPVVLYGVVYAVSVVLSVLKHVCMVCCQ